MDRISRNPMYLGVYATVLASVLYTMNPLVLIVGAVVVYVHHTIVQAEEEHMRTAFGREVRRILPSRRAVHRADPVQGLDRSLRQSAA